MNKKSFLKGKRFLVAQPMIRSFCGSTMVTLELAEYLSSLGAQVTVYTNIALSPALDYFKDAGIEVVTSRNEYNWSLKDYDYVWIHSLTIPQQLLEELKQPLKIPPIFVFLHMSGLDTIPDEHPWIFNLENSLSTLSLYISEEAMESNEKYGLPSKTGFFRNPALSDYESVSRRKISRKMKNVLIVSNHAPKEVLDARDELINDGIRVDVYGEGQDKYAPLSPGVLRKYDAVITIGKTVQYCIVGSLPVYVYDWFGGPGWLGDSNYELARKMNFSGRGFLKKSSKKIIYELLNGYSDALEYHLNHLAKHKDDYLIDAVIKKLLFGLKPRELKPFGSEYIESVKAAVGCAEIRFIASEELGRAYGYCDDLKREIEDYKKQVECIDDYKKQINKLTEEKKQLETVVNSKRFRMLNKVLGPHDRVKDIFKKTK